jgi:hypothetical protein
MEEAILLDDDLLYLTIMMMISRFHLMMMQCCEHFKVTFCVLSFRIIHHYGKSSKVFLQRFAIQSYGLKD